MRWFGFVGFSLKKLIYYLCGPLNHLPSFVACLNWSISLSVVYKLYCSMNFFTQLHSLVIVLTQKRKFTVILCRKHHLYFVQISGTLCLILLFTKKEKDTINSKISICKQYFHYMGIGISITSPPLNPSSMPNSSSKRWFKHNSEKAYAMPNLASNHYIIPVFMSPSTT